MIIAILVLIITLIIGIPVPFAFFTAIIYQVFVADYDPRALLPYGFGQLNNIVLLAIPLFIMLGTIVERSGIGDKIVEPIEILLRKFKRGLAIVTVLACAVFGSISGSAAATLTSVGTIMYSRLEKMGFPRGFSASLISSSSVLGLLVPPSAIMILFAWVGNQSVLAAFLSTVIPSIILVFFLSVVSIFYLRNKMTNVDGYAIEMNSSLKEFSNKSFKSSPSLLLPVLVLGGIYGGFLTMTEAAGLAVIYALFIGFVVYRGLTIKSLFKSLIESATTTGVVMVMLFATTILSRMFITEGVAEKVTGGFLAVSENKLILLLMINIAMIVIGMLMDDVSGVLLCTPILLPVAINIGVDPIHFAAILGVNLGMGNITPPTAPLLYLGGRVGKVPINEMLHPTMVLILFAWLPTLLITTYIPSVATFLPNLVLGQ